MRPEPNLETDRVGLRPLVEADAPDLFALDSDPEVMRFLGPLGMENVEAYRRWIAGLPLVTNGLGTLAAILKSNQAFLGWFHLRDAMRYRFAAEAGYRPGDLDLGYRLVRAHWGQGLATEVSRMLVARAFAVHRAPRVVATCLQTNRGSIRVLEKSGLVPISTFPLPGYVDLAIGFHVEAAGQPDSPAQGGGVAGE